ncbi:hypothetical protein [Ruania rhizosphaerae]|uniref:hypothetical protein n=1 Tax=Ruania rhizosphaerae TaxID=1840413 RepID=UPI00135C3924|nr:hypothetical protein [Ruania rhizosphaerae]
MVVSSFHAWVDESMHMAQGQLREGIYVLAATVADPSVCDEIRDLLRTLRTVPDAKLHWKDAGGSHRLRICERLADVGVFHAVVVGVSVDPRRQERARRLCMERLVFELAGHEVAQVWVESRTDSLNRRDRRLVDALRTRRVMPPAMMLDFALPREEPMLWFPDVVAGAIGLHRRGLDSRPYGLLEPRITESEIALDKR